MLGYDRHISQNKPLLKKRNIIFEALYLRCDTHFELKDDAGILACRPEMEAYFGIAPRELPKKNIVF